MTINYEYSDSENIVYTRPFDTLTITDFVQYVGWLQDDSAIRSGFVEVVDFSAVRNFVLSYNDSWSMRQVFEKLRQQKGYAGSVLIGSNDYLYGMARMFESALGDSVILGVTRTFEDAKMLVSSARNSSSFA